MIVLRRKRKTNRVRPPARRKKAARRFVLPGFSRLAVVGRAVALTTALVAVGVLAYRLLDRPVTAIKVTAPFQRVTEMLIEDEVRRGLSGGILSSDLSAVRARLEDVAWVDSVRIRRHWPSELHITVTEQVAAARWGRRGLLNTRGELFVDEARHLPAELPVLAGPEGSQWQVAQRYLTLRGPLLESGLQLLSVTLDTRGGWRLQLARGIEVRLGRQAVDRRIERLLDVVTPMIAGRAEAVDYVDLRYANGFAIGWNKKAPASPPYEDNADTETAGRPNA